MSAEMGKARCVYQQKSDEAYIVRPDLGFEQPAEVALCEWPDQHPERLVGAPRWLLRQIGGGLAIHPERDCRGCPAFRAIEGASV